MAGFFVATVICVVVQYKTWKKDDNKNTHPYHHYRY